MPTGKACDLKNLFETKPRLPSGNAAPPEDIKEKPPWSIPISVFKDYKFDTDEKYAKCFENDWAQTKLHKKVKDEN
jgi:hypothetical protein